MVRVRERAGKLTVKGELFPRQELFTSGYFNEDETVLVKALGVDLIDKK